jgi:hypothetical protein
LRYFFWRIFFVDHRQVFGFWERHTQ